MTDQSGSPHLKVSAIADDLTDTFTRPMSQGLWPALQAIWNNDKPTRWSVLTSYLNMVRTAWPILAAVVAALLIATGTSQGREALKYSVSLNYPGGHWRMVCSFLALMFFSAAVHEAVLRSINVYYPFSSRAEPRLRARFRVAAVAALALPVALLLFYLQNWVEYQESTFSWIGDVRARIGYGVVLVFIASAIYDFSTPAWRNPKPSAWLRAVETMAIWLLNALIIVWLLAFTSGVLAGPVMETVRNGLHTLDFASSAATGVYVSLAALLLSILWTTANTTTWMMRQFYSNTNQFFVYGRRRTRVSWAFVVVFAALMLGFALRPAAVAGFAGPVATLLVCLLALGGVFAFFAYLNARRESMPFAFFILGVAILSGAVGTSNYHNIQIQSVADRDDLSVQSVDEAVQSWVDARETSDAPAIIVLAEGGGIRAALHTAAVMTCLDSQDTEFYDSIFAMSGVSGGSVGLGAYLSARAEMNRGNQFRALEAQTGGCDFAFSPSNEVRPDRSYLPLLTTSFLQKDFFSPLMSGFMLRDFPMNISWCVFTDCSFKDKFDRAGVFEDSFRQGFRQTDADLRDGEADLEAPALGFLEAVAMASGTGGELGSGGAPPIVVFNTFDVRSGQPAIVSNVRYGDRLSGADLDEEPGWANAYPYWNVLDVIDPGSTPGAYLDVASAAHMSARFPLISPPGRLCPGNVDCDQRGAGPFIDGGYYDNSGAAGIQRAVAQLRRIAPDKPIVVLHINYRGLPGDLPEARLPAFFDFAVPLNGVLKARGAHGQVPIAQLCRTIEGDRLADGDSRCEDLNGFLADPVGARPADDCDGPNLRFQVAFKEDVSSSGYQWLTSPLQAQADEVCGGRDAYRETTSETPVYKPRPVDLPLGWLLGDAGEPILRRVDHQIPALHDALCLDGFATCSETPEGTTSPE
ncbi:MAG: hypothetical protein AAFX86_01305 [Pseudomonadota bacterium]